MQSGQGFGRVIFEELIKLLSRTGSAWPSWSTTHSEEAYVRHASGARCEMGTSLAGDDTTGVHTRETAVPQQPAGLHDFRLVGKRWSC